MADTLRRVTSGVWAGALAFAVNLGLSILTVPLVLSFWSSERYGAYLALVSFAAIAVSLDVGHQTFVGNDCLTAYRRSPAALLAVVLSGMRAAACLGAAQFIAAAALLWWDAGLVVDFSESSPLRSEFVRAALLTFLAWIPFGSVGGVLVKVFAPLGHFSEMQLWAAAHRTVQFVCLIVVGALGGGLVAVTLTTVVVNGLVSSVAFYRCYLLLRPHLSNHPERGSLGQGLRGIARSLAISLSSVLGQGGGGLINLLVGRVLDIAAIPVWATVRTISNVAVQAGMFVMSPLTPDIARLSVEGRGRDLTVVLWSVSVVLLWCGALAAALALPFVAPMYAVWTRGSLSFDPGLLALLIGAVLVRSVMSPQAMVLVVLNDARGQLQAAAAQTITAAVVGLALGPRMGLVAFALGVLAGEVLSGFLVWRRCCGLLHVGLTADGGRRLLACALAPSLVAIGAWCGYGFLGWKAWWATGVALPSVLAVAWLSFVLLPPTVRDALVQRGHQALKLVRAPKTL